MEYLPKLATIEQTCKWLEKTTNEKWILPRLIECGLRPYFWIDYTPNQPQLFGNRIEEGFLSEMTFNGDTMRLAAGLDDVVVNWLTNHNGETIRTGEGWRLPLSELKFKREEIEETAKLINDEKEPSQSKSEKPVSRFQAQEAAILKAIQDAGYIPKELPKNEAGKSGVKSIVRNNLKGNPLFVGKTVFKKAWERLQNTKEIMTVPPQSIPLIGGEECSCGG